MTVKKRFCRELEELMQERGYVVDHSTVQRWVIHYAPRIEKAFLSIASSRDLVAD